MRSSQLQGKSVVVTGASSGIGRAVAVAFAQRGADIVLAARRQDALEDIARELQVFGRTPLVAPTDVSDPTAVKALIDASLDHFGKIDVLVANAGVYFRCACRDLSVTDMESVMAVNLYGCVRCALEALPHMIERGEGHLVFVSSVDGKKGIPPDGAYVASKFALTGFAEVLRQELRGTGVYVSTIFPGRIDTPMIEDIDVPRISEKIPPERAAAAIVRAVTKRKPEVFVPSASGRMLVLVNSFSPRLGDELVRRFRLGGVRCAQP